LINLNAANELGYEKLRDLKAFFPNLMIVLMDMEHGPRYRRLARQAGADTFMSTISAPEELERLRRSYSELMA
jgi:DNA-binding NarL/FixJ family response regulator